MKIDSLDSWCPSLLPKLLVPPQVLCKLQKPSGVEILFRMQAVQIPNQQQGHPCPIFTRDSASVNLMSNHQNCPPFHDPLISHGSLQRRCSQFAIFGSATDGSQQVWGQATGFDGSSVVVKQTKSPAISGSLGTSIFKSSGFQMAIVFMVGLAVGMARKN